MARTMRIRDFQAMTAFGKAAGGAAAGLVFMLALAMTLSLAAVTPAAAQFMGSAIKADFDKAIAATQSESLKARLKAIEAHYAKNFYKPIWIEGGKPTKKAEEMVDALNLSYEDGLNPADYDAFELFAKLGARNTAGLADLEVHLTTAAVSYAQHMHSGRLDPNEVNKEIVIYPNSISADAILTNIRKTRTLKAYLRLLAPHTPRYERLRRALADYRRIEANGGWTRVAAGQTLKPGMSDPRVPALRKRMIEARDYRGPNSGTVYDAALVKAVKLFQEETGVTPDGVIGPGTLKQINTPVGARIKTMELNMERNRWMQNEFAPYHIFVNLADQVVKLVKNGDTLHAEVVQVGQPYHRTPVFTDEMEYVELNPYWNVPNSIAVNEYLPKLRRNPGVLAPVNISVLENGHPISASGRQLVELRQGQFSVQAAPEPGPGQCAGAHQVHVPQPVQRLHARHAGEVEVRRVRSAISAMAASGCTIR